MTTPTITVVIPTRDRPGRLAECLRAMSRQDYARGAWEVVVVDDGSMDADGVAAVIEPFRDLLDVQLLDQEQAGPATARNTGAAKAKFDYIAFTDDDCQPTEHWLSELAAAFDRAPDAVLGGRVVNGLDANLCSEASQILVGYVVDYFLEMEAPFFPSNNLALPRDTFEAIGGFDVQFEQAAGEDRDLCAKCRRSGIPMVLALDALVEHRHELHLRTFLRQHYNYGRGAFLCRRLQAARGADDFHIEPLRFYIDLVRAPFKTGQTPRGRLRVSTLLFLSQAANAAGFFGERIFSGRRGRAATNSAEQA